MVLEVALSMGCFLVLISHEEGASPHPSVAGPLPPLADAAGWGKGIYGPWKHSLSHLETLEVELRLQSNMYGKFALLLL